MSVPKDVLNPDLDDPAAVATALFEPVRLSDLGAEIVYLDSNVLHVIPSMLRLRRRPQLLPPGANPPGRGRAPVARS